MAPLSSFTSSGHKHVYLPEYNALNFTIIIQGNVYMCWVDLQN